MTGEMDNIQRRKNLMAANGHCIDTSRRPSRMEEVMLNTWGDGQRVWGDNECMVCGCPLGLADEAPDEFGGVQLTHTICQGCEDLVDEHYRRGYGDTQSAVFTPTEDPSLWERVCPKYYRDIILAGDLPHGSTQQVYDSVSNWKPGELKSLMVTGPSGSGKTTAAWNLYRNLIKSGGFHPYFVRSLELFRVLARSAKELQEDKKLINSQVLIIDDLAKERITPAACAMFWELLEIRVTEYKPTVITSRYLGDDLSRRFSDKDMGTDVVARIREHFKHETFYQSIKKGAA